MTPEAARQLEVDTRRPIGNGVLHPDECVAITICGAPWYVRPLQLPEGIRYVPEFSENVSFRQDIDPMGNEAIQRLAKNVVQLAKAEHEGLDLVSVVCEYVANLLDQQYETPAETKTELFSFRGQHLPSWVYQGLRHANGLNPIEPIKPLPKPVVTVQPECYRRQWWRFWRCK